VSIRRVNDLKEQIGALDLFKRCTEGIDELVWQLMDEAYGVREDGVGTTR
jgi:hypothetical protein